MPDFADCGIDVSGKSGGRVFVPCPLCSPSRKKAHQKLPCLTVDIDKEVWICNHCGSTGCLKTGWTGQNLNKINYNSMNKKSSNGSKHLYMDDNKKPSTTIYTYQDESYQDIMQAHRYYEKHEDGNNRPYFVKRFSQKRPDGNGGWINGLGENGTTRRVLYKLPELIDSTGAVYLCSGEKDVETLIAIGLNATTNSGGEGKWKEEYTPFFKDKKVVILEDNDEPGRKDGLMKSTALYGTAAKIKIIRFEELAENGDISDYLKERSFDEFLEKQSVAKLFTGNYSEYFGDEQEVDSADPTDSSNDASWPEPEPLIIESIKVPPFPLIVLPDESEPFIEGIATRLQCPPDYVAGSFEILLSTIVGNRCCIKPKRKDDWLVVPNLWGAIVGRPSSFKTPAMNSGLVNPLSNLETKAREEFKVETEKFEITLLKAEAKKKALKKDLESKAKTSDEMDKVINAWEASKENEDVPSLKRYKTNDPTVEMMGILLEQNPTGMLLVRDELMALFSSWDKPGREGDRSFYLESWPGDGSIVTDRVGRGTLFVDNLCISLFGGIQPGKLKAYLIGSMTGIQNDGLMQRLQILLFPEPIKDFKWIDEYADKAQKKRINKILEELAEIDFKEWGAVKGEFDKFPYFTFTDEAQEVFKDWYVKTIKETKEDNGNEMLQEHLAKYASLMPTLALLDHLFDIAIKSLDGLPSPTEEEIETNMVGISEKSALKATSFCEHLMKHAEKVYGLIANIELQAAAALLTKIKLRKLKDKFTTRDVERKNWALLNTPALVKSAFKELSETGWIREGETDKPTKGRQPLPFYSVNPKINNPNKETENSSNNPESSTDKTD